MIGMARYPDKFFDLAVVDPPYGLGEKISKGGGAHTKATVKFHHRYNANGTNWDVAPTKEYFIELKRISKHQIIWGGNYFDIGATRGFIIWDKPEMRIPTMSECEFAWTSFDKPAKIVPISRAGNDSQHPTQKPIKLYSWIYKHYLPEGGKVIDTHLGSGSNRIAADKAGNIDFTGFELDKDYYEAQEKRWKNYKSQLKLFV